MTELTIAIDAASRTARLREVSALAAGDLCSVTISGAPGADPSTMELVLCRDATMARPVAVASGFASVPGHARLVSCELRLDSLEMEDWFLSARSPLDDESSDAGADAVAAEAAVRADGWLVVADGARTWAACRVPVVLRDIVAAGPLPGGSVSSVVAGAVADALADKVDKVAGKGLSSNDFTDELKAKLDGIQQGAQANAISSVSVNGVPLSISGGGAVDVPVPVATSGLDNDGDGTSPFATEADVAAVASRVAALETSAPPSPGTRYATREDAAAAAAAAVAEVVDGAPEAFDTLKEVADWIAADGDAAGAVATAIAGKVDKVEGKGLSSNDFTDELKAKLDGLADTQADWDESDASSPAFVRNRPALASVATTGQYADLDGTPVLAAVATTGRYSDLNGAPRLASVATTGRYSDLIGIPASADGWSLRPRSPAQEADGSYRTEDMSVSALPVSTWLPWRWRTAPGYARPGDVAPQPSLSGGTWTGTDASGAVVTADPSQASADGTGQVLPVTFARAAEFELVSSSWPALRLRVRPELEELDVQSGASFQWAGLSWAPVSSPFSQSDVPGDVRRYSASGSAVLERSPGETVVRLPDARSDGTSRLVVLRTEAEDGADLSLLDESSDEVPAPAPAPSGKTTYVVMDGPGGPFAVRLTPDATLSVPGAPADAAAVGTRLAEMRTDRIKDSDGDAIDAEGNVYAAVLTYGDWTWTVDPPLPDGWTLDGIVTLGPSAEPAGDASSWYFSGGIAVPESEHGSMGGPDYFLGGDASSTRLSFTENFGVNGYDEYADLVPEGGWTITFSRAIVGTSSVKVDELVRRSGLVQADWDESSESSPSFIRNRPYYPGVVNMTLDPSEAWRLPTAGMVIGGLNSMRQEVANAVSAGVSGWIPYDGSGTPVVGENAPRLTWDDPENPTRAFVTKYVPITSQPPNEYSTESTDRYTSPETVVGTDGVPYERLGGGTGSDNWVAAFCAGDGTGTTEFRRYRRSVDPTLAQPGAAADAKATGDALRSGFTPWTFGGAAVPGVTYTVDITEYEGPVYIASLSGSDGTSETDGVDSPDVESISFTGSGITATRHRVGPTRTSQLVNDGDGVSPFATSAALSSKANAATTLAGYGINDAKIQNGVITLGGQSITPLTSVPTATGSQLGVVKPDGTTITIADGVLSAVGGGGGGGGSATGGHTLSFASNATIGYDHINYIEATPFTILRSNGCETVDVPSLGLGIRGMSWSNVLAILFYNTPGVSSVIITGDYVWRPAWADYLVGHGVGVLVPTSDIVVTEYYTSSCLSPDTRVLMADGTERRLDEVREGDIVAGPCGPDRVVAVSTGAGDAMDEWTFADGTVVKTVGRHRLWNRNLGELMYLEAWNLGEEAENANGSGVRLVGHRRVEGGRFPHATLFTEKFNLYYANGLLAGNRRSRRPS